jgi:hypothetical protein
MVTSIENEDENEIYSKFALKFSPRDVILFARMTCVVKMDAK